MTPSNMRPTGRIWDAIKHRRNDMRKLILAVLAITLLAGCATNGGSPSGYPGHNGGSTGP